MNILFLTGTFLLGAITTFVSFKLWVRKHIREKYISKETIKKTLKKNPPKRGLLDSTFTYTDPSKDTSKDVKVNLDIEFEVIEETDTKVKIKVVDVDCNNMGYMKPHHMENYEKAFSRWYNKSDKNLHFFKPNKQQIRKRKIEELLNE